MSVPRVLVLGKTGVSHLELLGELPAPTDVVIGADDEFVAREAPQAEVLLYAGTDAALFQRAWSQAARVRWVHSLWAGVEGILTPEFVASAVPLTNARGVFADALGEYALAAILYFAKDMPLMQRNQQARHWEWLSVDMARGKTLGVVGYGEIGRAAARLAAGIGMRVVAVRRRPDLLKGDGIADRVCAPHQLHEVLGESDYVVLAMPATPETRHAIGPAELGALKPSAVLINLGRGNAVDELALVDALRERRIRGAALDVFETEPLPPEHPLYTLDNVLISAHSADRTPRWLDRAVRLFVENYRRFVRGERLLNVVDKRAGY